MRRGITILILVFTILITAQSKFNFVKSQSDTIPDEAIRVRILANSNEQVDQEIKAKVRDEVIKLLYPKIKKVNDYESARIIIYDSVEEIKITINKVLNENSIETQYYVDYGLTNFPSKVYNNKTYKAGRYETLYIVLGEGNGDNFWCVLFPPLCLVDVTFDDGSLIDTNKDVNYSFYIIDKIKELFGYKD